MCQAQTFCDGKLIFNDVENHFIIRKFFSRTSSEHNSLPFQKVNLAATLDMYIISSLCTQCVLNTQSDVCVCLHTQRTV